jgi:hypothetical protein
MCENGQLKKIFGPEREVTGGLKNKNEKFNNLDLSVVHYYRDLINSEMVRACGTHGRDDECIKKFSR